MDDLSLRNQLTRRKLTRKGRANDEVMIRCSDHSKQTNCGRSPVKRNNRRSRGDSDKRPAQKGDSVSPAQVRAVSKKRSPLSASNIRAHTPEPLTEQILARLAPLQTANEGFTLNADHCIPRDPPWSESSCCRVASRGTVLQSTRTSRSKLLN